MMPRDWLAFLKMRSSVEMPLALRVFLAAFTGAGLSLSFTGFYLQLYSWVAVGLLLILVSLMMGAIFLPPLIAIAKQMVGKKKAPAESGEGKKQSRRAGPRHECRLLRP